MKTDKVSRRSHFRVSIKAARLCPLIKPLQDQLANSNLCRQPLHRAFELNLESKLNKSSENGAEDPAERGGNVFRGGELNPDLLCPRRRHRRGDLPDGGGPGDSWQVPLQEERDVPEPGSEEGQTGRRAGFPLQQPGRVPERLRGKPEGVFYISDAPTWLAVGFLSRRWRQTTSCQASGPQAQSRG